MMNNTNGFHPPSATMAYNGKSETSKRLPSTSSTSSTSSNSIIATNKRLKAKLAVPNANETRTMRKEKIKKAKPTSESIRKRTSQSDSNNNSTKKLKQSSHPRLLLSQTILQHHHHREKRSSSESIPSSTTKTSQQHYHHHHHNHHVINNDHCDSCGELYGEMISCDTCPATFHLLCANPPLSREDVPKGSYHCENCRARIEEEEFVSKDKQIKTNLPTQKAFSYDPRKKLNMNGLKQNSPLVPLKLPTASNGRSLIQPSGEIKFRATNTTTKTKSSTNLKRKRNDSSNSSSPITNTNNVQAIKIPTTQIESLRRLLLSCRPEEFRGPSLPFDDPTYNRDSYFQKNVLTWQKHCFVCRKSSTDHIPSIHCDYCPLTYHLDCLTPPMTALPSTADKWMCPNHIEPILDRYLWRKNQYSMTEKVKIYRQYSHIEHNTIIQEFAHMRQTKKHLLSKASDNHRLERIDISHIPKVIEQYYLNANKKSNQIHDNQIDDAVIQVQEKADFVETSVEPHHCSSSYDPCVWDIIQAILNHITDGRAYDFDSCSLNENDSKTPICENPQMNVVDKIDILLNELNQPNYIIERNKIHNNGIVALLAAADLCSSKDENSSPLLKQISTSSTHAFSLLIDLSKFRLSHAALIHTRSKHVIYLRKQVIWFGSSTTNDICLQDFNQHQTCQYVTERHACLYYDRKRNLFELLNYSEYGTIVNGLRYGLGNLSDNESDDDDDDNGTDKPFENEHNLQKCFCLQAPLYHSAWDGPAQVEQGTVIQIGCHEFIFYRHVVR